MLAFDEPGEQAGGTPSLRGGHVCLAHGLRTAPDGLCIICRRSAPPSGYSYRKVATIGAAFIAVAVAVVWLRESERALAVAAEPAVMQIEAAQAEQAPVAPQPPSPPDLTGGEAPSPAPHHRLEEPTTVATAPPTPDAPALEAQLSAQEALAMVSVRMYATSWCGACRRARAFMNTNGVAYTEYDVDNDAAAKARANALNPRGGVPVIQIDDDVIVGFSAETFAASLEQAISRRSHRPVKVSFGN